MTNCYFLYSPRCLQFSTPFLVHMSSLKMGLDQAVLQGIENSAGKDIMTKEEVERLLKHGAYDIFKEERDGECQTLQLFSPGHIFLNFTLGLSEKESNDFVSQDIDSILARRAKRVVHENTGSKSNLSGGTFSKASFKNVNSDGVATIDIDVDDPDFWTKTVGDAEEEEDQLLGKRKRAQLSYSETEYLKRLDAAIQDGIEGSVFDDNASLSSEWSAESKYDECLHHENETLRTIFKATTFIKKERYQWGGSAKTEWKQADAELVLKLLGRFGYGNILWTKFISMCSVCKSMEYDEIKRMCWSLVLLCLCEAAEDIALEVSLKAKKSIEGDTLARTDSIALFGSNSEVEYKEDLVEESFTKLLLLNKLWVERALADAYKFSKKVVSNRDIQYVQFIVDGNLPIKDSYEANPVKSKLIAAFLDDVWPVLRTRGWKNDEKKSNVFMYQGKLFKSIFFVLDAVPKYHPELKNMVDSLISTIAGSCKQSAVFHPVVKLDLDCVTAATLKLFLLNFAPIQLLADRKRAQRIVLTKRRLSKLVLLSAVHKVKLSIINALSFCS